MLTGALITAGVVTAGFAYDALKTKIWGARKSDQRYAFSLIGWSFDSAPEGELASPVAMLFGHISVKITRLSDKAVCFFGGVRLDSGNRGYLHVAEDHYYPEFGYKAVSEETYYISEDSYQAAMAVIENTKKNPPKQGFSGWSWADNYANCASWALEVAYAAGVSGGTWVDRYLISWPRLMSQVGSTPKSKKG